MVVPGVPPSYIRLLRPWCGPTTAILYSMRTEEEAIPRFTRSRRMAVPIRAGEEGHGRLPPGGAFPVPDARGEEGFEALVREPEHAVLDACEDGSNTSRRSSTTPSLPAHA